MLSASGLRFPEDSARWRSPANRLWTLGQPELTTFFQFIYFVLKAGPHEVKAGFELAVQSRVTLNF